MRNGTELHYPTTDSSDDHPRSGVIPNIAETVANEPPRSHRTIKLKGRSFWL